MITIHNLTQKQKMLLDVMWNIENLQQVNDFINSLPYKDKIDARSLLQIAIDESIEHEGGLTEWADEAQQAIDFAQKR
jgi:FtsZ-binding cell division protein ZapB